LCSAELLLHKDMLFLGSGHNVPCFDHFVGAPRSLPASVWSLEHALGADRDLHDQGRRCGAELLLRNVIQLCGAELLLHKDMLF